MLKGTPSWIYHKIFCRQLSKINYESLEKLLGAVHWMQHLTIFLYSISLELIWLMVKSLKHNTISATGMKTHCPLPSYSI
jgi:hypothetical protein